MSQRRLRTASLVALFVVTSFVAVSACSSGAQHDEVTAGGAAGFDRAPSSLASGGAFVLEAGATSEGGASGIKDEAETAGESSGPSNGGAPELNASAGAANGGAASPSAAGSQNGGAPSAGTSGVSSAGTFDAGNANAGVSNGGVSNGGISGVDKSNAGVSNGGVSNAGAGSGGSAGSFIEPLACLPATTTADPAQLYFPCAVNTALAVCWHCHGAQPVSGTPYSLTTYAQVKAVAGLVYGTVLSNYMPRPPYIMTTTDKAALLNWLGKDGTCAVGMKLGCGQREE